MNIDLDALFDSAHDHSLAGRYSEAIQDYQAVLQFDPENANAHFDLHLAYRKTGYFKLALQELDEATRLSPNNSDIYDSRAYLCDVLALKKNAPVLQEIVSQLPSDAENRQIFLGLLAYQGEDYLRALTYFENARREHPGEGYIDGYIGRTLIYLGRYAEAQKSLIAATRHEGTRSTELYNLAIAEKNSGNYHAVIQALERAVQLDNNYYKAWIMLASTEWRLGQWRSAWRHFRQAVKCSPQMQPGVEVTV
jgi:tetratricopeptide (TPR) repeat protein